MIAKRETQARNGVTKSGETETQGKQGEKNPKIVSKHSSYNLPNDISEDSFVLVCIVEGKTRSGSGILIRRERNKTFSTDE